MILVADASPLIFLAKLNRLELIRPLFGKNILVPQLVVDEVMLPTLPPDEELALQRFFEKATIEKIHPTKKKSLSLSVADMAVYDLAAERKADFILTDDRLLRRLLIAEKLVPLGTIGILIYATKKELLTKQETRSCLDDLIKKHHLRIGIELFKRILEQLDSM
jgi:predicted nucleic acid-binding protein